MIKRLTPEREALLPVYRDKWMAIGLSCDRLNEAAAKDAASRAYIVAGLKPPKRFVICDSPQSGAIAAAMLRASVRASVWNSVRASVRASVWNSVRASVRASVRDSVWNSVWNSVRASVWDSVGDSVWNSVRASVWDSVVYSVRDSVWDSVYGAHDAHWLGYYDYFLSVCKIAACEKLRPLMDLAQVCGWWIPYENVCILQHRHSELHRDERGRLHNPSGMAVKYRDGWGVYAWHGVRIPNDKEWIITTPYDINPITINQESNQELKRVMLERYTPERYIKEVNAKTLDTNGNYVLYRASVDNDEPLAMLRCIDTSTGREYFLRVPPTMQSAWQALARAFGMEEREYMPIHES